MSERIKLCVVSLTQCFHVPLCMFCWSLITGESRSWLNFSHVIILCCNTKALAYGLSIWKLGKFVYIVCCYIYTSLSIYMCMCFYKCLVTLLCVCVSTGVGSSCKCHFQFCFPVLSPGLVCYKAIFLSTVLEDYSSRFNQGWTPDRWWVNHARANTECW